MPSLDPFTTSLLTNKAVIKMHKESSEVRQLFQKDGKVAITSKNKKTGETYLALFNISDNPSVEVKVNLSDLNVKGGVKIVNMWTGKKVGTFKEAFGQNLSAHACGLYKISSL